MEKDCKFYPFEGDHNGLEQIVIGPVPVAFTNPNYIHLIDVLNPESGPVWFLFSVDLLETTIYRRVVRPRLIMTNFDHWVLVISMSYVGDGPVCSERHPIWRAQYDRQGCRLSTVDRDKLVKVAFG